MMKENKLLSIFSMVCSVSVDIVEASNREKGTRATERSVKRMEGVFMPNGFDSLPCPMANAILKAKGMRPPL